jgi:hypothetical protein
MDEGVKILKAIIRAIEAGGLCPLSSTSLCVVENHGHQLDLQTAVANARDYVRRADRGKGELPS